MNKKSKTLKKSNLKNKRKNKAKMKYKRICILIKKSRRKRTKRKRYTKTKKMKQFGPNRLHQGEHTLAMFNFTVVISVKQEEYNVFQD